MKWALLVLIAAALVGLCWLLAAAGQAQPGEALAGPWVHWGGRGALVVAALAGWFLTQSMIAGRPPVEGAVGDLVHDLTAGLNRRLHASPKAADRLLIMSSLGIDLFGLALFGFGLLGPSMRPFVALMLLFLFRQLCQACCALPAPPGIIWRHPGFPSLLVTYGVGNDFFISGHTAIAVLGACWAWSALPWWAAAIATAMAVGEACTVLILRAHWTMDVLAAITAAWCAWALAGSICVGF